MNLIEILKNCDERGLVFIKNIEDKKKLSYNSLFFNAKKRLNFLKQKGLKESDKLIFQFEDNEAFVTTFWACLIGKIIPIPLSMANNNEYKSKLLSIYNFLDNPFIISDIDLKNKIKEDLNIIEYKDEDIHNFSSEIEVSEINESDIAFIQFSSGSTSEPKGAILTHGNLLHNLKSFSISANITKSDKFLSWFPLTHDMGLIGWHLVPLFNSTEQVLINTNLFVRRASIWLESATKFKSTILCSPNFGYHHFLKLADPSKLNLNLSNVRLIFNGAEPISASLCDEFLERLAPYGLRETSMYTVYGLAEATLAVAFPKPESLFKRYSLDSNYLSIGKKVRDVDNGVVYVDVGYANFEFEIRIVDDEKRVLSEDFVGHIEIKSKSVMNGYYKAKELTEEVLRDGWLDTGDLGFLRENRLIIIGRAKDVIIINGLNYYPHDIERVAEEVNGCDLNRVVACGIRDKSQEREELILFVLFKKSVKEFEPIAKELKIHILKKIGLIVKDVVSVKKIPKTTSGKLQRFKLKEAYINGEFDKDGDLLEILKNLTKEFIDDEVDINKPLFEQGFNSIKSVAFIEKLSQKLNREINISAIFDNPSLQELALFLENKIDNQEIKVTKVSEIAIVGMGLRVGSAKSVDEFWNMLLNGLDFVSIAPKKRFNEGIYGNFLSDIDKFDNEFFDISEVEAISLDPQQRILLETTYEALESAGVDINKLKNSKTGVFIGISNNDYAMNSLRDIENIDTYSLTGNILSTASGRISYTFGLHGPSLSIDTACSSSLSAIHLACQSLRSGESTLAIAGGVNLILSNEINIALSKVDAISHSGKCKSFDEDADGYVRGEGCGVIILKPLEKAIEDRDNIIATIKSSAINHDGKSNGLTAPNGTAQIKLIKEALSKANLKPNNISYIETHGTGTNLGDPIEANAIGSIFSEPLFIGAIKSNIGHLESSAGVFGVIKTALSLQNGFIPPNLHFNKLNPHIKVTNLKVVDKITSFNDNMSYAGVSSFGFSGTNVHTILAKAPKIKEVEDKTPFKIFVFSAKDIATLEKYLIKFKNFILNSSEKLKDIAYSTLVKTYYKYRVAFVVKSRDELINSIDNYLKAKVDESCVIKSKENIIFPSKLIHKSEFIALAKAFVNGEDIDFSKILSGKKVHLPVYIFNSKSFWLEDKKEVNLSSISHLKEIILKLSPSKSFDANSNFIEAGFDSLTLLQLKNIIKKEFDVNIEIRDFFSKFQNFKALAKYIDENKKSITNELNKNLSYDNNNLQSLFKKQIDSMNELFAKQLETIKAKRVVKRDNENIKCLSLKQINLEDDILNLQKELFLKEFIKKYNIKTKKSKEFTVENKSGLVDWIHTITFRKSLKEITYPIVAKSANGSKFIDIDDNEYIDISMGYGSNFFGHNQNFINEAISKELQNGFILAPQTPLVREVVSLIKEFTNLKRVCFSNTGTEAVMASLRIVRAVSKKDIIIKFKGSFHGTSNEVLSTSEDGVLYPTSLGVTNGAIDDIVEFHYGSDEVFEYIEKNHSIIAGVLVEPIQSRRPEFAPVEFLKKLREVTTKFDIAYILDEMITGFRVAKGGVQELFDIKADIVLYGKAIANSMPIGIIAGSAKYLDSIDGGFFSFGDESVPKDEMITFGGTFCKHPLTLASMLAGLNKMKERNYQEELNLKTKVFADEINEFFKIENIPIKVNYFGSLFKFESYDKYALALNPIEMDLFFYMLLYKGVYTWEKRICFFSVAHTKEDIKNLIIKIKETIIELKEVTFFVENSYKLIPTTSFQERLYIVTQFENLTLTYNQSYSWRIKVLNIEKLEKAITIIINRHEALRTSFEFQNEKLYQKIHNSYEFKIEFKESINLDEDVKEFITSAFDLTKLPLFKVLILKNSGEYTIIIKNHHSIFDGISFDILIDEIKRIYEDKNLNELSKNYSDFTREYLEYLNSKRFEDDRDFWMKKLSDSKLIHLPIDNSYPKIRTSKGESFSFEIDKNLTTRLKNLSKKLRVTINIVLMASFNILLSKLSNQKEITIGVPVTSREGDYFKTIGMFANTIVFKSKVDVNEYFGDYVATIRDEFFEVIEHLNYPLEILLNDIKVKRDMSKNPLFNIMFVYEKAHRENISLNGEELKRYSIVKDKIDFDLTLEIIDEEEKLKATFEYYEIFSKESILKWKEYFINILTTITHIDTTIKEIDILSDSEKRLLSSFNNTNIDFPDKTIIEIFEERVETSPNAIVLIYENIEFSYKELNERVNKIANYLVENFNIKGDDFIAIIVDRSEYLIIILLAILKSGGAYVAIDKAFPNDRIEYILEDCQPKVILSDSDKIGVNIHSIENQNIQNPNVNIKLNNIAYVIYTSGTTGKPKGVMIEHHSLMNRLFWMAEKYQFDSNDIILQKTPYSFDVSLWELFLWILSNSKLSILKPNEHKEPQKIIEVIKRDKVTTIHFVPSMLNLFLNYINENKITLENFLSLNKVFVSGEALNISTLKLFNSIFKKVDLYNLYGPTEATIDVTYFDCVNFSDKYNSIPIGKPVANTEVYILDNNLNQVPIGVEGELHIAGIQLARGYLNKDELTKERFITHPKFGRIYKSGDLAKWLNDGNIEYIGRSDEQVKIRGFRIELGEIEVTLKEHEEIKEVSLKLKDEKLLAYYVADRELNDLKEFLAKKLPEYMLPSNYMKIDSIPLTINGKVDKKALPDIEIKNEYIAPTNEIEKKLALIFSEVLNKKVGVNDNFFENGGDSIKAIQIVSKANRESLKITIQDIFKYQTIKTLASKAQVLKEKRVIREIIGGIDLTPVQKWFFELEINKNHFNQAIELKTKDKLNLKALNEAFKEVINYHEMLRATFEDSKQNIKNSINFEVEFLIDEVDIKTLQSSLNLRDKLLKVFVKDNSIYIIIHHLIIDGVSWRILIDDLSEAYTLAKENMQISFPPKSDSYKLYSQRLKEYSLKFLSEAKFWNEVSNKKFEKLTLDNTYIDNYFGDTIEIEFNLSETKTKELKESNKTYNTRVNELTLLALLKALNELMGINDIAITLEAHGREDILNLNLSRTIGWFSSIYPIVLTLPQKDLSYQIKHIKEEIRSVSNGGIGYGILKYLTNELNSNIKPEIVFNYLGEFDFNSNEFIFSKDRLGNEVSKDLKRKSLIDIDVMIIDSKLKTSIRYNTKHFNSSTIDNLLNLYHNKIDEIVKFCSGKESEFTSTDFDYKINLDDLEGLFND